MTALVIVGLVLAGVVAAVRMGRRRKRTRAEASLLASDLIPEIRTILDSSGSEGEPLSASRFALTRQRFPRLFGEETLFAVETFYQCADAYRDASKAMQVAFSETTGASLGDRIRAKDRRDRCLKDVYYTGQAAIERLSQLKLLPAQEPGEDEGRHDGGV